jgi:hypothetical protein
MTIESMSNRDGAKKRRLALVVVVVVALLAGCGGGSKTTSSTTTTTATVPGPNPAAAMRALIVKQPNLAGKVTTLYNGGNWSVVQSVRPGAAHAVAFRLVRNKWVPDQSGNVKIEILGPQPGAVAPKVPQVAIQFTASQPFVESALWVDGTELLEKGGGSPTRGTIYGAPAGALKPGQHVAVGYARTNLTGTATAWIFKVA